MATVATVVDWPTGTDLETWLGPGTFSADTADDFDTLVIEATRIATAHIPTSKLPFNGQQCYVDLRRAIVLIAAQMLTERGPMNTGVGGGELAQRLAGQSGVADRILLRYTNYTEF